MLSQEMLAQIVALTHTPTTLRAVQIASVRFRLSPAVLHSVRLRYRRLVTYADKRFGGFIKYRWELPNGCPDGLRYTWWAGKPSILAYMYAAVYYINGVRHGVDVEWHTIGQICNYRTRFNGMLHGEYRYYGIIGELKERLTYVNGERHGIQYYYNIDGTYTTVTYVFGARI